MSDAQITPCRAALSELAAAVRGYFAAHAAYNALPALDVKPLVKKKAYQRMRMARSDLGRATQRAEAVMSYTPETNHAAE